MLLLRRHVAPGYAAAATALLALGLVPVTLGLLAPYKADVRGLLDELTAIQEGRPDVTIVFLGEGPPAGWQAASDRAVAELAARRLEEPIPDRCRPVPLHGWVVVRCI
jgi:hypothetical protein